MSDLLRIYQPSECGPDGYPLVWHKGEPAVKDLIREQARHRCVRCLHPFLVGESPGQWSRCDDQCEHKGPLRVNVGDGDFLTDLDGSDEYTAAEVIAGYSAPVEAEWRVLTVHHLTGVKTDLRWWNLAALCQRCHLQIQGRVQMEQVYAHEHSPWFKPYAAGYYAATYLHEDLDREQTEERQEELLALELAA